jgi:diaminohydroxyphosphoribosylaminopyrimidine deaminase / 5-amino-6-(5-phosphoribosylamino)uracil reductase
VDLEGGLRALGERGLLDVLVEGGPTLGGALWEAGLVDRGVFYLAGRLAGGVGLPALAGRFATLAAAREIVFTSVERAGPDLCVEFVVKES